MYKFVAECWYITKDGKALSGCLFEDAGSAAFVSVLTEEDVEAHQVDPAEPSFKMREYADVWERRGVVLISSVYSMELNEALQKIRDGGGDVPLEPLPSTRTDHDGPF